MYILLLIYLFINKKLHQVFVAALGLSLVEESGTTPTAVHWLLTAAASLVAEHRL